MKLQVMMGGAAATRAAKAGAQKPALGAKHLRV